MRYIKYILFTAAAFLLASCVLPFDPELDDDPVIFLESFPGADDVVVFNVLPAYSNSNTASRPEFRPGIVFTVNGREVPVVRNDGQAVCDRYSEKLYIADYKPLPGDKMTVRISAEGFRDIYAETMIPEAFPERRIDYRLETIGDREFNRLHVSFSDDPETDYSYGIQIHNEIVKYLPDTTYVSFSRSAGNQISDYYDMAPESSEGMSLPFDDGYLAAWDGTSFDRRDIGLSVIVVSYGYGEISAYDSFFVYEGEDVLYDDYGNEKGTYKYISRNKMILYTMTEEFYRYSVAQNLIDTNADFIAGLAPSNFCYTNIENGYGAFAGVSCVETDWITPEFIENNR